MIAHVQYNNRVEQNFQSARALLLSDRFAAHGEFSPGFCFPSGNIGKYGH
jgi:hypothetical protein